MKKTVKRAFDWAHRGVEIEHFEVGREVDTDAEDTDQEMVEVADREGWFEDDSEDGQKKATQRATQRQAAQAAPETK